MSATDLASLLCSRLCHDLVGPVGSLYNGVELLADETDPAMRQSCMDLLAASAQQTANKLKFFRLAFGAAGGFAESVATREAQAALEGLYAGDKRVTVEWTVAPDALPKRATKILLNLAMTAGDSLLRGGRLNVAADVGGRVVELAVRAEGARVLLDAELKAALEGRADIAALNPRAAAAYMVRTLCDEAGAELLIQQPAEGTLVFGAVVPAGV